MNSFIFHELFKLQVEIDILRSKMLLKPEKTIESLLIEKIFEYQKLHLITPEARNKTIIFPKISFNYVKNNYIILDKSFIKGLPEGIVFFFQDN